MLLFSRKHQFPSCALGTWYDPKKHNKDFIFKDVLLSKKLGNEWGVRRRLCEICSFLCSGGGGGKGETSVFYTIASMCPLPFTDPCVCLSPHDFATMCLTSCEFTGKAISQINGY